MPRLYKELGGRTPPGVYERTLKTLSKKRAIQEANRIKSTGQKAYVVPMPAGHYSVFRLLVDETHIWDK